MGVTDIGWTATVLPDGTQLPGFTFNGWSLKQRLPTFLLLQISCAIWFKMLKFMAFVTEGNSVRYLETKSREKCVRFDVMGAQIASFAIAAMLASEVVAYENGFSPRLIFRGTPIIHVALKTPMRIGIVVLATLYAFFYDLADFLSGFRSVFLPRSIRRPGLGGEAHFFSRLLTHFFALHWGNKCSASLLPRFSHFGFCFFRMLHNQSSITPSNLAI
jgi:hypothetical protein